MKSLPIIGLTSEEKCVLQQMINRRGVVTVNDVKLIAEMCGIEYVEAMTLVNGTNEVGKQINEMVNDAVGWQPILSKERRAAYAQVIFEDKIGRRKDAGLPLSDKDAIEILDYVRKEVDQPGSVNVNVDKIETIFDFSGMDIRQLEATISNIQNMIDSGEIIDGEFTEISELTALANDAKGSRIGAEEEAEKESIGATAEQ